MEDENIGQRLQGDRIQTSPFRLHMKTDMYCEQICIANLGSIEKSGDKEPNQIVQAIRRNYHHNFIVDNLSAASRSEDDSTVATRYWQGFPVGFVGYDRKAYVHNHVNIEIHIHPIEMDEILYRVVRLTVQPFSIRHDFERIQNGTADQDAVAKIKNPIPSCDRRQLFSHTNYEMITHTGREPQFASGNVLFTYDVIWIQNNDQKWASRWDIYLSMDHATPYNVHWRYLPISVIILITLFAILVNGVNSRNERLQYSALETGEEAAAGPTPGWIAIRKDVARPPECLPMFFIVLCSTGAQLLSTSLVIVAFAALGFMSAARRGRLLVGALLTFACMGVVAGYARIS